jgi:hypothetical protein
VIEVFVLADPAAPRGVTLLLQSSKDSIQGLSRAPSWRAHVRRQNSRVIGGCSYPYTKFMADGDTVLEEAMDNLKEAGQRIRATQSLMRSQGMTDGERTTVTSSRASPRRSP